MAKESKFDAVVIGAGHNGLVAANYLARAGKAVCVVEARDVVGGACVTEELIPGSRWSSCSFVQGMLRPEIISDLDLHSHGLTSIAPDVQGLGLWDDGDHVMLHKDVDATLKSIEAHSRPDGRGFFEFGSRLKRFADLTRDWLLSDPPERSEVFARFEAAGENDLLNEFMLLSASDLLDRYITSDRLKGYMMFLGMVSIWGGPHTPTTAWVYGYHACGEFEGAFGRWALPVGGMGSITQALMRGAEAHGAVVRTGRPSRRSSSRRVARVASASSAARSSGPMSCCPTLYRAGHSVGCFRRVFFPPARPPPWSGSTRAAPWPVCTYWSTNCLTGSASNPASARSTGGMPS
jgi:phytoene dehydrogenase-like protein